MYKNYNSSVLLFIICILIFYLLFNRYYVNLALNIDLIFDGYFTMILNRYYLYKPLFFLFIFILPMFMLSLLWYGVSMLTNTNSDSKIDENINEFLIIKFFRWYAYKIDTYLEYINKLLVLFGLFCMITIFIQQCFFTLGFLIDFIFNTRLLTWNEYGNKILMINFGILMCLFVVYFVLTLKYIYFFYVKTNFPIYKFSKINLTYWLTASHNKLNNNYHIAYVIDKALHKYVISGHQGIKYYLKKFELGSIARIIFIFLISKILKIIYLITKPVLIFIKAKYFYYLTLPFIYIFTFIFNFIISTLYNALKYFIAFSTFFIYMSQVIAWIIISLCALFLILYINSITFNFILHNHSIYMIFVNILTFIVMNTFLALLVYVIIPEFSMYSNPSVVKESFEYNIKNLETRIEKIRTLIFAVISLILVIVILAYFGYMYGKDIDYSTLYNEFQSKVKMLHYTVFNSIDRWLSKYV